METTKSTLKPSPRKIAELVAIVIIAAFLGWICSGIFHEFGHALAVLLFGGTITELQPFVWVGAPHVAYVGSFTMAQKAIVSVSGAGTVYGVGFLFLLIFPLGRVTSRIKLALTLGVTPFFAQSISYMLIPIPYHLNIPIQDDVINFIEFSSLNPLWISLAASVLVTLGILVIVKRTKIFTTIQIVATR